MSDHAKYAKDFVDYGIPVYTAAGTEASLMAAGTATRAILPLKRYKIGNFTVTPFNVPHEPNIECYGYLVEHREMGKLLFLTDLEYCKYSFKNQKINHIMVEANYDPRYVDLDDANTEHIFKGHMSIETTCDFLRHNNNIYLEDVVLCHLSTLNANSAEFISKVKEIVKCPVFVAENGIEIVLGGKCPF